MATQTRRTTRRSARFFRATVKASMVTACCGLVLWSAVAAYAELPLNGLPLNGLTTNGIPLNGVPLNGMPIQGLPMNGLILNGVGPNGLPTPPREPFSAVPPESLPFHSVSQKALGTTPPVRIGFLRPCSRYQLGPLCL
jgi:hypothetical protein